MLIKIYGKDRIIKMKASDIVSNFGILYRTFVSYTREALADTDISFSDSVFLAQIGQSEGISQEQIARSHMIDRAAIARSVKEMEKKGYVITRRSATDRRAKELNLTKKGKEMYQYITAKNQERLSHLFADIPEEDKNSFVSTLKRLADKAVELEIVP